ncbi:alpha/beta fold hydrolase [Nocardia transvalensis]|uniref:alpha/beta fold hydrolase n=1 Tax=Nocardia transvalensis TaxID=37333 RepID=UPI00189498D7|nr:alpha/beta hydrolase [Nocardia transvalensis]MBF6331213.1 alpha/beta hydrolase [Nocardia transvalensis]
MTDHLTTPDGIRLAYVDSGGPGRPLLALHGTFGRGRCWMPLAQRLGRRIIAPDQRGHGRSDKPGDYSREGFVADAVAVIEKLGLGPVTIVGHSLGAINAYQIAARRPDLVEAFVAIDFPVSAGEFADPWLAELPTRFDSLTEMHDALGRLVSMGVPFHFLESAVEDEDGWYFPWDADDMRAVKRGVIGDWWDDWTGSAQPALVLLGGDSAVVPPDHAREMVARRPNTELAVVEGAGHDVYLSHVDEVAAIVGRFLAER